MENRMSKDTTDNFWAAWGQQIEATLPIFYRLYHDDQGYPLFYSMEDLPGNYIDIDQETYALSSSKVRVVNGKLKKNTIAPTGKLIPDTMGIACHPKDICIVVPEDQKHIKWSFTKND
jgi:hypothetical protein